MHVFYDMKIPNVKELFDDAKEKAYNTRIDILDCSISMSRQRSELSYDEILELYNNQCHTVFIVRRYDWPGTHLEIGFSTMKSPSYFLFINVDIEHLDFFVKKYDLKKM